MLTQLNNYSITTVPSLLCICLMQQGLEASLAFGREKGDVTGPLSPSGWGMLQRGEVRSRGCTDVDTSPASTMDLIEQLAELKR